MEPFIRVFAEVIKLRCHGVGPNPTLVSLVIGGDLDTEHGVTTEAELERCTYNSKD